MNNKKPNTAVIVLNWNGIHFLQKFIPILIQNTPADIADIIVADNASTDNSVKYIQDTFPQVKLIVLTKNYGYAEGYNQAIAQTNYKYSVLINSDIEVSKNWLEPLVQQMENNPRTAACQPKIRDYKQKEFFEYAGAAGGYIDYLGYPFCRGRIFDKLEKEGAPKEKLEELGAGKLKIAVVDGDISWGSVMMGQSAGLVRKEQTVEEIIKEMFDEAKAIIRKLPERVF